MNGSRVTPWTLLAEDENALAERLSAQDVLEGSRRAVGAVGAPVWAALTGELAGILRRLCEVDLAVPLVRGWCGYRELRRAGEATLGTEQTATVDLDRRKVTLTKQPRVELVVAHGPVTDVVAVLAFQLRVEVTAHALVAVVRSGRLVSLSGGRLDVAVSLHAGGRQLLAASRSCPAEAVVPLGDGIVLAAVPAQRESGAATGEGSRTGSPSRIDSPRS